ncbi:hypothetical protein M5X11_19100 [Paenibacillus alginolyticus]|uniref:hypothetical protein n=1 Tax=Paenibacillus alginolyticus TaxID=59839 RepID=UPI0012B623D0|nr:hypothetical protein [Paenibacillus alginolyticus]MCY9667015.1 hypothetical protein [Paenibacillus alginolyticus]
MKESKSYKKKGMVKKILKDHFPGFWLMHAETYPESVRKSIEETVHKAKWEI